MQGASLRDRAFVASRSNPQAVSTKGFNPLRGELMMDWQPIETAPKDTPILIFDHGEIVVAERLSHWHPEAFSGTYDDGNARWFPTHWMPLPEPPHA